MEENTAFCLPELLLEAWAAPGSVLCSRTKLDLHGGSSPKVCVLQVFLGLALPGFTFWNSCDMMGASNKDLLIVRSTVWVGEELIGVSSSSLS